MKAVSLKEQRLRDNQSVDKETATVNTVKHLSKDDKQAPRREVMVRGANQQNKLDLKP